MKKQLINILSLMVLMVGLTTTYSVQAQTSANRNYDRQAINLLKNIESKTSAYKSIVNRGYNNSDIVSYITDFETTTKQLRQKLNSRQQVMPNDVENVLSRANFIENYMKNNRSTNSTQSQWNSIKTDLNSLAQYYNVSWSWNNNSYNNSIGRRTRFHYQR